MGLTREPYSAIVTGKPLTETVEVHKLVDLQTKLVDDLKVKEGYLEVTDANGNKYYEKIYSGQTIADFMTDMGNLGIQTSLDEETGVLTITGGAFKTLSDADVKALVANATIVEPDTRYQQGTNLLACLYGADTISTDQITVASTYSKTKALRHTVTNTINATKNTTLDKLGLSANGTATFDVRGESRTINLTTTMTISDLMNQLKNAGIGSSFNEDTSRLTIENATITGGTSDLATVLDLTTTISGKYVTSSELYVSYTITVDATRDTLLKDYGISDTMSEADRTVTIYNSDGSVAATTVVGQGTTIGNLIDFINNQTGISASLKDGFLTINNGYIGNATLEASMGLTKSNKSSYVLGSIMTITTSAAVTGDTTLGNIISTLGTTEAVRDGYTLIFNSNSLDVSASSTINDIINLIYANGGTASLDNTGRLSINGGTLTGTVATALGVVSVTNTSSVSATGETIYTTQEEYADRDTILADLGINNSVSYELHSNIGAVTKTVTFANTATIGNVLDSLKSDGIDAIISNGVISLDSADGRYITGSVANAFGITVQTVTETINTTMSSTLGVTHTGTVTADETTTLEKIGAVTLQAGQTIEIHDEAQNVIGTITFQTTDTIGGLFEELKKYGISGTITDGVITLYSGEGNYITGSVADNLGISVENGVSTTITIGKTVTSTVAITFTDNVKATYEDKISSFITIGDKNTLTVYNSDNSAIGTYTVTNTTTFDELFRALASYGIDGDIHDGVISLSSPEGAYASGAIFDSLGIGMVTVTVTTTTGSTQTSGTLQHTVNQSAQITDVMTTFTAGAAGTVTIMDNGTSVGTVTIGDTTTFEQFFKALDDYGIQATMEDGVITITSNQGRYLTGAPLTALGITTSTTTETITTITTTGGTKTSGTLQHTVNQSAQITDVMTTFTAGAAGTVTIMDNGTSVGTVTIGDTTTFEQFFKALDDYGIQATMEDGVITITSNQGRYLTGAPLTALGITTSTTTETITTITTTGGTKTSGTLQHTVNQSAQITDVMTTFTAGAAGTVTIMDNGTSVGTVTIGDTTTFEQFFKALDDYGIQATMEDGVITITSNQGRYLTGAPMTALGITTSTTTETITTTSGISITSTAAVTYTETSAITEDTLVKDLGFGVPDMTIGNSKTGRSDELCFDSMTTTFNDMFTALASYGVTAYIENGIIHMSVPDGISISNCDDFFASLGIDFSNPDSTVTRTVVVGRTATSSHAITYTHTSVATSSSLISDFVEIVDYNITGIINSDGSISGGSIVGIYTADDLVHMQNDTTGYDGYTFVMMNDITLEGADGAIKWQGIGIRAAFKGIFDGNGHTLGIDITSDDWEFGLFNSIGNGGVLQNLTVYGTISAPGADSVGVVLGADGAIIQNVAVDGLNLEAWGGNGAGIACYAYDTTITNCYVKISELIDVSSCGGIVYYSNNCVISGNIIDNSYDSEIRGIGYTLRSSTISNNYYATGSAYNSESDCNFTNNAQGITIDQINAASGGTFLTNYNWNYDSTNGWRPKVVSNLVVSSSTSGSPIGTILVTNTTTFEELINKLSGYDINAYILDGVITLDSPSGYYVTGNLCRALGISTTTTGTYYTVGLSSTSSIPVTYTTVTTADTNTTLKELYYNIGEIGSIDNPYHCSIISISTVDELAQLANFVNSGSDMYGYTFILENDIAFNSDASWIPIGIDELHSFAGTFDGCGYTISGLTQTMTADDTVGGLFGYVNDATIKNLNLANVSITVSEPSANYKYVAPLIGKIGESHYGRYTDIHGIEVTDVHIDISESNCASVGGLVGEVDDADVSISNCRITSCDLENSSTIRGSATGGLIGYIYNSSNIYINKVSCHANTTHANYYVGGIIGYSIRSNLEISNSLHHGTFAEPSISGTYMGGIIGGIAHDKNSITIQYSYHYGDLSGDIIGGLVGMTKSTMGRKSTLRCIKSFSKSNATLLIGKESSLNQNTNSSHLVSSEVELKTRAQDANWARSIWDFSGALPELVINNDYSVVVEGPIVVTFNANTTLSKVFDTVNNNGGNMSLIDGNFNYTNCHIVPFKGYYSKLFVTSIAGMTSDTKLGQLGYSSGLEVTLVADGTTKTFTASSSATVGDFVDMLDSYGIFAYVDNNKLTIQASENAYIQIANLSKFNMESGEDKTYDTKTIYANTTSDTITTSIRHTLTSETTFKDIDSVNSYYSYEVYSDGKYYTITMSTSSTVDDFLTTLAGFGIAGSVKDGIITLYCTEDAYINSFLSGNLNSAIQITDSQCKTTKVETIQCDYTSSILAFSTTSNIDSTSLFSSLGLAAAATIGVNYLGQNYTVTVNTDDTVDDMLTTLADLGISGSINNGLLTLCGTNNGYITSISDSLKNILKLNGNTYTTTTETTISGFNSLSNRQMHSVTLNADETTKMSDLGSGMTGTITVNYNGNSYNVTATGSKTIGEVLAELAGYGISGSIVNGVVTLHGTKNGFITNAGNAFGLTGSSYTTSTATVTKTEGFNSLSNQQMHSVTLNADENTKMSALGSGMTGTITVNYNGNSYNVTATGSKTIGEVLAELAGYGISGSIVNGVVTLHGTKNGFITNAGNAFGLTGSSYTTSTATVTKTEGFNSLSNQQMHSVTLNADENTKMSDLGSGMTGTITVNYNGNSYNVTATGSKTIGEVLAELAGYGISGSIVNGVVTLHGTKNGFITNAGNAFGLTGSSYTTSTDTLKHNTTSSEQNRSVTTSLSTSTTFAKLGLAQNGYITVVSNGTEHVITVTSDKTVDDIISTIAGFGISASVADGKISFNANNGCYIKGMTQNVQGALKINIGQNNSWTTEEGKTWINTNSDEQSYVTNTIKLTGDTILSSINGWNNGNGSLIVRKTNGQFVTISVDGSKTLDEFFEQISQYGIIGSVDSQGVVTITGVGNTYLQQDTNGSNILEALKLSNVVTNVKTVTVNRTSDTLSHVVTVAAKGTTTLENLQDKTGQSITFDALGKAGLILHAYSDAGNTFVTLNFSKTDTIYDVIDKLAEYGVDARLDADGRFSISSSTLTDFDLSGNLGTFLMGTYTKNYGKDTTNNVSTLLVEHTITKMTDASKLTDFGITGGNIRVIQEGKSYTVNVDMTKIKTIGDFRSLLAQYGFNSYIDDAGRLNVLGIGNSTLEQIDGGSNILDRLGLLDWTKGEITQSSSHLTDTNKVIRKISMSDKLKDLTNSAGVNLGITAGQIYVYQDGTRSVLNIDINDTLETLAAKLSQYGISVGISQEGKLYFDGNNDSYLTTDGIITANASNILQKFDISGNWSTRYDSTSKNLNYTENEDKKVNGSTKLSDLKDTNGNNLGITTGSFYVYNSGVRNTETITDDMTVNDLMSTLAKYGLVADFDENGVMSVGAYNNTYLATSALAGDNSNIVNTLFAEWNFVNIYKSNHLDIPTDEIRAITRDTKLADINEGTYEAGYITVVKDGVKTNISLTADDTVGTLMDELALYGFESVINDKGQLMIKNTGDSLLQRYDGTGKASNALALLGIDLNNWINTSTYDSKTLEVTSTTTNDVNASRDTLLSELGVSTGEYFIYNNGVKFTAMISSDETLGSFMDTLKSFGIETSLVDGADGSVLTIIGKGDSYIKKSTSTTNASNVVEKLFTSDAKSSLEYKGLEQTSSIQTTFTAATEDTLVSYFDKPWNGSTLTSAGDLTVEVNGQKSTIKISADETFGSLLEKFKALGLEATMSKDGQIMIQSGYDTMTILQDGTTSNLLGNINLQYKDDLGGYSASSTVLEATTSDIVEKTLSVANYADGATKMGMLNISDGSLTVYRNGQKATIQIKADETFDQLRTRLSTAFADLDLAFENGYLKIFSKDGKNVEVGSTTDTSNFSAITGIQKDENGNVMSARELYCVNGDSTITTSGIFRRGDITKGTFTIGNAVFTIDDNTTLSGLIAQINSSDEANATAFWDNVDGQFVIKSRSTGAALVNIEAGTSNFTDIMGFTTTATVDVKKDDGSIEKQQVSKLNIGTQEIGENAKVKINGTTYTATSNTITSDITRIKGLTINLKGLTKDSAVTLKVERDKETLANAVSGVVDSYNELMKNVDEAIASDGDLKNESTLKLIRNQLRNLMTSSDAGTTVFRNLDSIGISVAAASGNNIATTNSAIVSLAFDKDKFLKAYEADQDAVKGLIIGGANNKVFSQKLKTLLNQH